MVTLHTWWTSFKKNLLVRRASAEDRRVIYAELTAEGKEFFEAIFPQHQELMVKVLSGLSEDESAGGDAAAQAGDQCGEDVVDLYKF